jgi:type 2 lantibiotic biosynthesis protein LanM
MNRFSLRELLLFGAKSLTLKVYSAYYGSIMLCSTPLVKTIDLTAIVANASFLWERLDTERFLIENHSTVESEIQQRLDRWCQSIARGNYSKLQTRLAWDGLDFDQVVQRLGRVQLAPHALLPSWAETLQQIILTAIEFKPQIESWLPIEAENPLPFEDLLLPAIQVARQTLFTRLGYLELAQNSFPLSLLSQEAYYSLERSLLKQLSKLCAKTFDAEFSLVRPFGQNLLQLLQVETESSSNKTHYTRFVEQLLQDGLLTFFQKYPVLGRLVATAVEFWVESIAEFLERLDQDQVAIQQTFTTTLQQLGKVTTIEPSLSDPHDRGRTVMTIAFESGLKLVYKPKNLALEAAFNDFLGWCNQKSNSLALKIVQVLNRDHYGWVEYIEHQPCANLPAAERFYERAGMLLCILYALRGTDCHNENLIAHDEHLVLIDAEALLYPEANPLGTSLNVQELTTTAAQQLSNSVLRTGLLPCWDFSGDRRVAYDVSGLGSTDPQQAPSKQPRWQAINTDEMRLRYESFTMPIERNVLLLDGVVLSANDYQSQIIKGFEQMYQVLMAHQAELFAVDSPLAIMQQQQIRFIFRPTRIYSIILQNARTPDCLKHGVDYSIALDQLSYVFLSYPEKPNAWAILSAELRSLEQLDIPLFTASAASDTLQLQSQQSIPQCFRQSSYDQVIDRLHALNETDLTWQVAIIQAAFHAKIAQTTAQSSELSNFEPSTLLTAEQLLQEVRTIATELEAKAILEPDGNVNWIGLSYVVEAERYQLQALNDSLYEGRCGVALFLAALYRVTGEARYRDLALQTLRSLRQQIQTADREAQSLETIGGAIGLASKIHDSVKLSIGGAIGLGSMIYAFVKISQFLDDATLLVEAEVLASWITPEQIAADQALDVVLGSAGAILGLVSLYEASGSKTALLVAIACGQHLLAQQTPVEDAPAAWLTVGEKPLTGFSHGAAGIAYALLRLYKVTQDQSYLNAALEGIEYERCAFFESAGNWLDLRSDQPDFLTQWCHGAAGIGLARSGSLAVINAPEIQQEIEIAVQTTQNYGLQLIDHLCCGNWGRVETLLVAAQCCQRPNWKQSALQNATQIVDRAKQNGGYRLFPNVPNSVFHPGFFQGTAGIGYQMLRLIDDRLPSVLVWQ